MTPVVRALLVLSLCLAPGAVLANAPIADRQARWEALQHYFYGQEFLSGERYQQAADQFRRAIASDHLLAGAHYGLGQANMALGLYVSAIKAYTDCIEALRALHGLEQQAQFTRARERDDYLREQRHRRTSAQSFRIHVEEWLAKFELQRPSLGSPFRPPGEVLLALGSAYFRNGDRELAEFEWGAAAEANPRLGAAHNNLAILYLQTGRKKDAIAAVKAAERAGYRVNQQVKDDIASMPEQSRATR